MDIVRKVKELLAACPYMTEFADSINVDFFSNDIDSFGMYSNGDSLVSTDIIGGQYRRHNFVLYALNQPISNYQRLENTGWLLRLGYWLDGIKNEEISEVITDEETGNEIEVQHGVIKKLSASNAMVFDVPTGDIKDGVRYQLQLQAEYYLNP